MNRTVKSVVIALICIAAAADVAALLHRPATFFSGQDDGLAISRFHKAGGSPSEPRPIRFLLYFPTDYGAERAASRLEAMGLKAEVTPSSSDRLPWQVLATRQMAPTAESIRTWRTDLNNLCATENGEYQGWGTSM